MQAEVSQSQDQYKSNKRYTAYKVQVKFGEDCWFIFRRYAEFDKLCSTLKKKFPYKEWRLPSKRFFGNNFEPSFINQRRQGLNEFISSVVSTIEVLTYPDVRAFLALDSTRNRISKKIDEVESMSKEGSEINLGPSADPYAKPSDFAYKLVIGKGSFGKVLLATHKKENKVYAVKVLQKRSITRRNEQKHIMAERNVLLKNFDNPFLVSLHYSFQTADKLYFVLDYVNGGELFFHLQRERTFSEYRARFYAAEIASAVGYMHSLNIIYRDLKPENILLDCDGHIKLTDFGLCKEGIESNQTTTTFCGTPEYLAPEVLKKQPYTKAVDWWCLGAVLYEMLYGLPPFYSQNTNEMYENILYKPLRLRSSASAAARLILNNLLQKKPESRLGSGLNDLTDIKEHEFFVSIDWERLENRQSTPPYNPNVSGPEDVRHVDPEFTKEPVTKSIQEDGNISRSTSGCTTCEICNTWTRSRPNVSVSVQEADDVFHGFSYAPPQDNDTNSHDSP